MNVWYQENPELLEALKKSIEENFFNALFSNGG